MDAGIPRRIDHCAVGIRIIFKRPFCDAFLDYCFENFHVGIWSSVMEVNAHRILDFVCKRTKPKLAFVMGQRDCTETEFTVPGDRSWPLFLKELKKVCARFRPGVFNASNTLLVDDSPHKAVRNPSFTAVFPETYGSHNGDDTFLCGTFGCFWRVFETHRMSRIMLKVIRLGCLPLQKKALIGTSTGRCRPWIICHHKCGMFPCLRSNIRIHQTTHLVGSSG